MNPAFITSLCVAIVLASGQAFGGPQAAPPGGVAAHPGGHPPAARAPHHNGRNIGAFFPATGGWFWGPSGPANNPNVNVTQSITGGPSYTCSLDIPGDWAHRCPPTLFASPPEPLPPPHVPYELGCPAQRVTVPGADGKDQTVSIVRC
jgi:hypothetical protein